MSKFYDRNDLISNKLSLLQNSVVYKYIFPWRKEHKMQYIEKFIYLWQVSATGCIELAILDYDKLCDDVRERIISKIFLFGRVAQAYLRK